MSEHFNPFDTYRVTFRPKRIDDLRAEARWWVGRTFDARASFVIEQGDYAGQWAFVASREAEREAGANLVGWFPECDFEFSWGNGCPYCKSSNTTVLDTMPSHYTCQACGKDSNWRPTER